jgi:hypothetical protein
MECVKALEDARSVSPSGRGVAQLRDLTSLRHAPQTLNLPQPPLQLVPTGEILAHQIRLQFPPPRSWAPPPESHPPLPPSAP